MRGGGIWPLAAAACTALGLSAAACSDGGAAAADASADEDGGMTDGGGQLPDASTEPCRYAADEPGARALYIARLDSIESATVYVIDVADPNRACAIYEGAHPEASWVGGGDAVVVSDDGFLYWIDVSGGAARAPVFVSRAEDVRLSPSARWLTFTRYGPDAPPATRHAAPIDATGVGEPIELDASWSPLYRWAPEADAVITTNGAAGELIWVRLDGAGIAESRPLLPLDGGRLAGAYWSPDGSKVVAAVTLDGVSSRLFLWQLDEGGPGEIHELPLPDGVGAQGPVWSPDSRRLAYRVGDATHVVDVSSLPPGPPEVIELASPSLWWSSATVVVQDVEGDLMVTAVTGDDALTPFKAFDALAMYGMTPPPMSPDRRRLAYASSSEIEFANLYRELTAPPGTPVDLGLSSYPDGSWAPDSATLLLSRIDGTAPVELALVRIGADGPVAHELLWDRELRRDLSEVWAPDSSAVVLLDHFGADPTIVDATAAQPQLIPLDVPREPSSVLARWLWAPLPGGER